MGGAGVAKGQLLLADVGGGIDGRGREGAEDEGVIEQLFGVFGGEEAVEIGWRSGGRGGMAGFGVEGHGFGFGNRDIHKAIENDGRASDAGGGGWGIAPAVF